MFTACSRCDCNKCKYVSLETPCTTFIKGAAIKGYWQLERIRMVTWTKSILRISPVACNFLASSKTPDSYIFSRVGRMSFETSGFRDNSLITKFGISGCWDKNSNSRSIRILIFSRMGRAEPNTCTKDFKKSCKTDSKIMANSLLFDRK